MITLILGGNKSGKSDYALNRLANLPKPQLFVATGKAGDPEFRAQIMDHRRDRGPEIEVMEISEDLHQSLIKAKADFPSVLVDSLDFWLFAVSASSGRDQAVGELMDLLNNWGETNLVLVSCEAGLGPLPMSGEVRKFIRSLGALNQDIARIADEVVLVAAGLPLTLKKA